MMVSVVENIKIYRKNFFRLKYSHGHIPMLRPGDKFTYNLLPGKGLITTVDFVNDEG
jgi:hypothetical protein